MFHLSDSKAKVILFALIFSISLTVAGTLKSPNLVLSLRMEDADFSTAPALSFDGTNDTVSTPFFPLDNRSFTITTWMNPSLAANGQWFVNKESTANNKIIHLMVNTDGSLGFRFFGNDLDAPAGAVSAGAWQHLAYTFYNGSPKSRKIYVNGSIKASDLPSSAFLGTTGIVNFGSGDPSAGNFINCKLRDVRVYNRDLSGAEVLDSYNGKPPTSGLIANWKLTDMSGTTAVDSAGSYNGTLTNGPTWVNDTPNGNLSLSGGATLTAGKFGKAVSLDGSTRYVEVAHRSALNTQADLAISAWIKATAFTPATNSGNMIVSKGDWTTDNSYSLVFYGNGTNDSLWCNIGKSMAFASSLGYSISNFSTGTWYHVLCQADSSGHKLYVNGTLVASNATASTTMTDTNPLRIGRLSANAGNVSMFNGLIDEVQIYNRALSPAEIRQAALSYPASWKPKPTCPSPARGYFVLSSWTAGGNMAGMVGANMKCLDELSGLNWKDKDCATLTSSNVQAFLCDGSTCNSLTASKTYQFAVSGDPTKGGATFTTDASGLGPQNSDNWSGATYFGTAVDVWANRGTTSATLWSNSPNSASDDCTGWTGAGSAQKGYFGNTGSTTAVRWNSARVGCNNVKKMICLVNP